MSGGDVIPFGRKPEPTPLLGWPLSGVDVTDAEQLATALVQVTGAAINALALLDETMCHLEDQCRRDDLPYLRTLGEPLTIPAEPTTSAPVEDGWMW